MKNRLFKPLLLLFATGILLFDMGDAKAQTNVDIGPTTGSSSYFYGPYYRSSASSSFDYSLYAYVYTNAELNLTAGSLITDLGWLKESGILSGNNELEIWMENSTSNTLTTSTTWSSLVGSATSVYSSTTRSFLAAANSYEMSTLSVPFLYTGGSLIILVSHKKNGTASAANNFYYESATNKAIGWASSTAPTSSTSLSSGSYGNNRPTIRITYMAGTPCSGQPDAGAIAAADTISICPSLEFSLADTGSTIASGLEYQWQERNPSGTGSWTDIAGANTASLSISNGITTQTDYRVYITCTNSNLSDTTSIVTAKVKDGLECYCIPAGAGDNADEIVNFTLSNLNNTSTPGSSGNGDGYTDFTDTVAAADLTPFQDYVASLTSGGGSGNHGAAIWIDYNNDGIFQSTEMVSSLPSSIGGSSTALFPSFSVENYPGVHRLRVQYVYSENGSNLDPCLVSTSYGETEDYLVNIIPLASCDTSTIPSNLTALVTKDTFCQSANFTLSLDSVIQLDGITYNWQASPDGLSNWTDVDTAQVINKLSLSNITESTWYRAQILCQGTVDTVSSSVFVYVSNPEILNVYNGSRCGDGPVTLYVVESNTTSLVNWYDSETSSTPLSSGSTFITPSLSATDTFWVQASSNATQVFSEWTGSLATPSYGSFYNPLYNLYETQKLQILYKASELQALGLIAGPIESLGINLGYVGAALNNFEMKIGTTTASALTNTFETGLTSVYSSPSQSFVANSVNTFTFLAPYIWDGTSNIVVEICYAHNDWGYDSEVSFTTNVGFTASHTQYADGSPNQCAAPTGSHSTSTNRVDLQFNMTVPCSGPRVPVIATINPAGSNPTVDLGNNSDLCEGDEIDAGNAGSTYFWNTGDTTQTIQPTTAGTYWVFVTNANGCTDGDTIDINTVAPLPTADDIIADAGTNAGDFTFSLDNGNNVDTYDWDFGDGNNDTDPDPEHSYTQDGSYDVTVIISNDCGSDTLTTTVNVQGVGINQIHLNDNQLQLYPNPARDIVTLQNKSSFKMKTVEVYNILGQRIFETTFSNTNEYQLKVNGYASGIYHIRITFDDGNWISRKFEIRK